MKMKLFKYGYLIRYAFDLGRVFPILVKHRNVSKIVSAVNFELVELPTIIWMQVATIQHKLLFYWSGLSLNL